VTERTILCFGDSNTWGSPPGGGERFPRQVRWPGALQGLLGEGYYVIEEGLNGRTATLDHPWVEGRSGRSYLLPCCSSHAPLDLVIVYLGTNDLADFYNFSAAEVAEACASLAKVVRSAECGRKGGTPPVLLVCPPPIRATGPDAAEYETAAAKSRMLGARFANAAEAVGAELLDLDGVVAYAEDDPIHLDAEGHRALAEAVAPLVRRLAQWPAAAVSI
jgi:lysophospholipase L1-like esterase